MGIAFAIDEAWLRKTHIAPGVLLREASRIMKA
jgi:hypothetical protein